MVHDVAPESASVDEGTQQPSPSLPAPRLQLRWSRGAGDGWCRDWRCDYELVLPLGAFDIRREVWKDGEQVGERAELVLCINGHTNRGGDRTPCDDDAGGKFFDAPFRDGVHAKWDSERLGGLPIYVIAPDGTAIQPDDGDAKLSSTTDDGSARNMDQLSQREG